jgi:hypothetical protein
MSHHLFSERSFNLSRSPARTQCPRPGKNILKVQKLSWLLLNVSQIFLDFLGGLGAQNIDTFLKQPEFDRPATHSQLLPLAVSLRSFV